MHEYYKKCYTIFYLCGRNVLQYFYVCVRSDIQVFLECIQEPQLTFDMQNHIYADNVGIKMYLFSYNYCKDLARFNHSYIICNNDIVFRKVRHMFFSVRASFYAFFVYLLIIFGIFLLCIYVFDGFTICGFRIISRRLNIAGLIIFHLSYIAVRWNQKSWQFLPFADQSQLYFFTNFHNRKSRQRLIQDRAC